MNQGNKMFNCKNHHSKCKAGCCGIVPMSKERWDRNQDKIVTSPIKVEYPGWTGKMETKDKREWVMEGEVLPITETLKCCFLNEDLSCNIYEDRPDICREFGSEDHLQLSCPYQNKDGKDRSRQAKRMIERKQASSMEMFKIL